MVNSYMEVIDETLDESGIRRKPKLEFKNLIKPKIKEASLKYLRDIQQHHSKTNHIVYEKHEM